MAGLTNSGFETKRLDEILSEIKESMRLVFGENLNLDPSSADGQIAGILAESYANLWELASAVNDAFNLSSATGKSLIDLAKLSHINSKLSTSTTSSLSLNISSVAGSQYSNTVSIAEDFLISDQDNNDYSIFLILDSVEIQPPFALKNLFVFDGTNYTEEVESAILGLGGEGGYTLVAVNVYARNIKSGKIIAEDDTINIIDNPILNLISVSNFDTTVGTSNESDAELRARIVRSPGVNALNTKDSIYSLVANINTVSSAIVIENDTDLIDENGLLPHSIFVAVSAGNTSKDMEDIATAISLKKPGGIQTNGDISVTLTDSQDVDFVINYSYAQKVFINLTVSIFYKKDEGYYDSEIALKLGEYISNSKIGEDILISKLYCSLDFFDDEIAYLEDIYFTDYADLKNLSIDFRSIAIAGDILIS